MDIVYLGGIVLLFVTMVAIITGCARLGGEK